MLSALQRLWMFQSSRCIHFFRQPWRDGKMTSSPLNLKPDQLPTSLASLDGLFHSERFWMAWPREGISMSFLASSFSFHIFHLRFFFLPANDWRNQSGSGDLRVFIQPVSSSLAMLNCLSMMDLRSLHFRKRSLTDAGNKISSTFPCSSFTMATRSWFPIILHPKLMADVPC